VQINDVKLGYQECLHTRVSRPEVVCYLTYGVVVGEKKRLDRAFHVTYQTLDCHVFLLALLSRSDGRVEDWPSRNLHHVARGFALMNTSLNGGMGRLGRRYLHRFSPLSIGVGTHSGSSL
jgi:hypothetical protein